MRARFYQNPWTQYNYLLKSSERIPLDVRSGTYATINSDLEHELLMPIDSLRGPFCRFAYISHQAEGTGLLIFHQNHAVGDGRCCEIVLSQLLKLYDGQDVPYFCNTKSLYQMCKVRQDRLTKFHYIEAQMPRHGPNSITETFVDPKHPSFEARFEGICLEIVRLDAADTRRLLEACRRRRTTVTAAMGAAVSYAVMAELLDRQRTTEFVTVGMTMNERGRSLGPEFDEECGNLVGDMHIHCEPRSDFWETASEVSRLYTQVLQADCTYEATVAQIDLMQHREPLLLLQRASQGHLAALSGGLEHVNMASFGVLKRYGRYGSFEVLENFANSHALFLGCKVNLCTSGASGRLTACVMVTRNVVPHARELACKLRDHIDATLGGIIAEEGSAGNLRALQWCGEVALGMDLAVQERRAQLALAPRGGDGVVFQGETGGNYGLATHLKLVCNIIFTIIAGGGLSGFPIYQPLLKAAGVFSHVCAPGQRTCKAQDAALSDMYQLATFLTFGVSVLSGYLYDILGARESAVAGALLACASMLVIGCTITLDAQEFPNTQVLLLHFSFIMGDVGDLLSSFSLLGWMWHYPRCQTFIIGLQNGAFQGSSMFGILFVWMVGAGFRLYQGFFLIALTNLISACGFYFCTPSKREYFEEAGKVLNRHAGGMDQAVFVGFTHLKLQIRSIWGVMKLFALENLAFWMSWPFVCAFLFQWLGSFAEKFRDWFGAGGARALVGFFAGAYSPIGIVLNPVAGLLMDVIGFRVYLAGCSCVMLSSLLLEPLRSIPAQKACIVAIACGMGTFQNAQQRWCVLFGPPDLFGTWMGLSLGWMGVGAILVEALLGSGGGTFTVSLSIIWQLACLALLVARGMPRQPPRNMYDSPDFLRGK
mmetsp:Transcript_116791/g.341956  ORF Transcript_116791/g.341956 Transcript_116791/m.341956 type:complete len:880 (-) Transcript_116791:98-2737(-)